ncbi:hypothetical protein BD410DRAFT_867662 [Rickenella mellea]|uniref:JmjC domain-containing protein n=1 Tax=Rickenella mellea TaxID=50990 RepID=A0A4Y7PGP1_9AGAM|nr:hypothetical protein BD410DRAFT_867662 [Rickenella mellea]
MESTRSPGGHVGDCKVLRLSKTPSITQASLRDDERALLRGRQFIETSRPSYAPSLPVSTKSRSGSSNAHHPRRSNPSSSYDIDGFEIFQGPSRTISRQPAREPTPSPTPGPSRAVQRRPPPPPLPGNPSPSPPPLPSSRSTIKAVASEHSRVHDAKYFRGEQVVKLINDFMAFKKGGNGCVFEWFNSCGDMDGFVSRTVPNNWLDHYSMQCACNIFLKKNQGSDYQRQFKNCQIESPPWYCWACYLPAEAPFNHTILSADEKAILSMKGNGCETLDFVKELAYLIWIDKQLFPELVTPLLKGLNYETLNKIDVFKRWCIRKPQNPKMWSNPIELVYNYGKWRGICDSTSPALSASIEDQRDKSRQARPTDASTAILSMSEHPIPSLLATTPVTCMADVPNPSAMASVSILTNATTSTEDRRPLPSSSSSDDPSSSRALVLTPSASFSMATIGNSAANPIDLVNWEFMQDPSPNGTGTLATHRFSRSLMSTVWYGSPEGWCKLRKMAFDSTPLRLLQKLWENVCGFEQDLRDDFETNDCTLASVAFNFGTEITLVHAPYVHGVMQVAVLDRMLFLSENLDIQDATAIITAPRQMISNLNKKSQPTGMVRQWQEDIRERWQAQIIKFGQVFAQSQTATETQLPVGDNTSPYAVAAALSSAFTTSRNQAISAIVFNNFVSAAMGLLALNLGRPEKRGEAWSTRFWRNLDVSRRKEMTDQRFFGALYSATAFSPVILLLGTNWTQGSQTSKQMTLVKFEEVILSSLRLALRSPQIIPHPHLLVIERDCWFVIAEMAMQGPGIYHQHMSKFVAKWSNLLAIPPPSIPLAMVLDAPESDNKVKEDEAKWLIDTFKTVGKQLKQKQKLSVSVLLPRGRKRADTSTEVPAIVPLLTVVKSAMESVRHKPEPAEHPKVVAAVPNVRQIRSAEERKTPARLPTLASGELVVSSTLTKRKRKKAQPARKLARSDTARDVADAEGEKEAEEDEEESEEEVNGDAQDQAAVKNTVEPPAVTSAETPVNPDPPAPTEQAVPVSAQNETVDPPAPTKQVAQFRRRMSLILPLPTANLDPEIIPTPSLDAPKDVDSVNEGCDMDGNMDNVEEIPSDHVQDSSGSGEVEMESEAPSNQPSAEVTDTSKVVDDPFDGDLSDIGEEESKDKEPPVIDVEELERGYKMVEFSDGKEVKLFGTTEYIRYDPNKIVKTFTRTLPIKTPSVNARGELEWSEPHFVLKEFDVQNFRAAAQPIFERLVDASDSRPVGSVWTVPRGVWEASSADDMLKRFAINHIHVVGKANDNMAPGLDGWEEDKIADFFDVWERREVHDMSRPYNPKDLMKRMGNLTLDDFLSRRKAPNPNGPRLEVGSTLHNSVQVPGGWSTPWPSPALTWALFASEGAVSVDHTDATGMATFLRPILGAKLWLIAVNARRKFEKCEGLPSATKGWDDEEYDWQAAYLQEGDDLYMMPATPHFVFTTEDCLTFGGHFYSAANFVDTLRALTLEHFMGSAITNAQHSKSVFILVKVFVQYCIEREFCLVRPMVKRRERRNINNLLVSVPTWDQFAALVVIISNLNCLPVEPQDGTPRSQIWQNAASFGHDRPTMLRYVGKLPKLFKEEGLYDALDAAEKCITNQPLAPPFPPRKLPRIAQSTQIATSATPATPVSSASKSYRKLLSTRSHAHGMTTNTPEKAKPSKGSPAGAVVAPENAKPSKGSPTQAAVKAILDSGVHVAISPNMTIIPEISIAHGEAIRARRDGMYGWAECSKWPTFITVRWEHLVCVPIRPEWRDSRTFMEWKSDIMKRYKPESEKVLWMDLEPKDYSSRDPLDLEKGTIHPQIIRDIRETTNHVIALAQLTGVKVFGTQKKQNMDDPKSWMDREQALAFHLISRAHCAVFKLTKFRDRRMDLLLSFREVQRSVLELMGWVAYNAEIRFGLFNTPSEMPEHPYPVNGAFVCDYTKVLQLRYAGIPVWLVCESEQFPEVIASAKEVQMKLLDQFFVKDAWSDDAHLTPIKVKVERHFCRTKLERQAAEGPGLSLAGVSQNKLRDAQAPQLLAHYQSTMITNRLGTNGFFLATEPIPDSLENTTTSKTILSSIDLPTFRYEPYPPSKKTKNKKMLGKLFTNAEYPLTLAPLWNETLKWLSALETEINARPKNRAERILPPANIMTKENSGPFVSAWLALRREWIPWLMKEQTKGFAHEDWKALLRRRAVNELENAPPPPVSRDGKRQEERHATLARIIALLKKMRIEETWKSDGESLWNGFVVTAEGYKTLYQAKHPMIQEIAYEITELNFRFDILSLDAYMLRQDYVTIPGLAGSRQRKLFTIFRQEAFVDKDSIRTPDIWALTPKERLPYTSQLASFMRAWPSWPEQLSVPLEEGELATAERNVFKHYTFVFLHTFNRYPSVPCVRPASVSVWYREYCDSFEVLGAASYLATQSRKASDEDKSHELRSKPGDTVDEGGVYSTNFGPVPFPSLKRQGPISG